MFDPSRAYVLFRRQVVRRDPCRSVPVSAMASRRSATKTRSVRPILRRMPKDRSPVVAVQRFVASLLEIRTRLLDDLAPIAGVVDLQAAVRSRRELPREGVTSSGIEYSVHGAGCRMVAPDGREVDVDLVADPKFHRDVEAFDSWRIRWFLDEAAEDGFSNEEIVAACAYHARQGLLREVVEGRWYALPEHVEMLANGNSPVE